jgi:peptidoglycan hydrolase-like protein with peptidoglycan-binding domain
VHAVRSTIRLGSTGTDVAAWQVIIGARPDGKFGQETARLTRKWQSKRGLVPDAIVGPKSWALAGEKVAVAPVAGDPRAPACLAARRDADAAWPTRKKQSDGIMGDARHQKTKSGHNSGNAIDITHDVWGGADCNEIARLARLDPRTQYTIWNGVIWNADIDAAEGSGRQYDPKKNQHRHHIHIEVRPERREDASAWPWAPVD